MGAYLIVGMSRGLGLAFADQLSQDNNNTVIGTVRSVKSATGDVSSRENVHLIELDVTQPLKEFHQAFKNIDRIAPEGLDVVIYGAGVLSKIFTGLTESTPEEFVNDFNVNFVGGVKTWLSVGPYLYKGSGTKRIVYLSSTAAQIKDITYPSLSYGVSKVAINHYVRQISLLNLVSGNQARKDSIALALHPGFVDTDMVTEIKDMSGLPPLLTIQQSASAVLKTISSATKEQDGGYFDETGCPLTY